MSKFYLVHTTYVVREYYMINDVCLVYDSHPVIEFWHCMFSYLSPYSGFFFFSVSLLTAWTKWSKSCYLALSFGLKFFPSYLLIRVTDWQKIIISIFVFQTFQPECYFNPPLHSSLETCFSRCCPDWAIVSLSLMMSATAQKNRVEVKN